LRVCACARMCVCVYVCACVGEKKNENQTRSQVTGWSRCEPSSLLLWHACECESWHTYECHIHMYKWESCHTYIYYCQPFPLLLQHTYQCESWYTHECESWYTHECESWYTHECESWYTHECESWYIHKCESWYTHQCESWYTHQCESWYTHECESCHGITEISHGAHKWISHIPHMNESCHTYEWVMSHIWMIHGICFSPAHARVAHTRTQVMSRNNLNKSWRNESYHTYEWVMAYVSHQEWRTHECESCHAITDTIN